MKKCATCKQDKAKSEFNKLSRAKDGLNFYCRSCSKQSYLKCINKNPDRTRRMAKERIKKWSDKNKSRAAEIVHKYTVRNKKKKVAHYFVGNAIKAGWIQKHPCYICNNPNSEAHHEDYNLPNDIYWLCRLCHNARHIELRKNAET